MFVHRQELLPSLETTSSRCANQVANPGTLVLQPGATFGQGRALIGRNGVWRVIASLAAGEGTPLAWSPDGTACFVAMGTTDAQQVLDRLLRVIVPG